MISVYTILDEIAPLELCIFLENYGWNSYPIKRDDIKIYQLERISDNDEPVQITIPLDKSIPDYQIAMVKALDTAVTEISKEYNVPEEYVLSEIKETIEEKTYIDNTRHKRICLVCMSEMDADATKCPFCGFIYPAMVSSVSQNDYKKFIGNLAQEYRNKNHIIPNEQQHTNLSPSNDSDLHATDTFNNKIAEELRITLEKQQQEAKELLLDIEKMRNQFLEDTQTDHGRIHFLLGMNIAITLTAFVLLVIIMLSIR